MALIDIAQVVLALLATRKEGVPNLGIKLFCARRNLTELFDDIGGDIGFEFAVAETLIIPAIPQKLCSIVQECPELLGTDP